jgi:hypothetical protein
MAKEEPKAVGVRLEAARRGPLSETLKQEGDWQADAAKALQKKRPRDA